MFFAEVNLTQLILQSSFPHFHDRTLLQRWQTKQQHGVHRSHTQLANLHHGQCAVVGSSGHLLRNRHGRDIDASDMVFRVNAAQLMDSSRMSALGLTCAYGEHVTISELIGVGWTILAQTLRSIASP